MPSIPWAVSKNYVTSLLWPVLVAGGAFVVSPLWASIAAVVATVAWAVYVSLDGCEFREGRPDPKYSRESWLLKTMRTYLRLQLHRTAEVEEKLLAASTSGKGQASENGPSGNPSGH